MRIHLDRLLGTGFASRAYALAVHNRLRIVRVSTMAIICLVMLVRASRLYQR